MSNNIEACLPFPYLNELDRLFNKERLICPPELKDDDEGRPIFCVAYPDTYVNGLPNLGVGLIVQQLIEGGAKPSRAYLPCETKLRNLTLLPIKRDKNGERLPVGDHDIISLNLSFETLAPNALKMLQLAGIPLTTKERNQDKPLREEKHPLVIGGGPFLSYNPEPMAPFFDLICIGDAEKMIPSIVKFWRECSEKGLTRKETLLQMAKHAPGVYVPSFYQVEYNPDGTVCSRVALFDEIPNEISRQWTPSLDPNLVRTLYDTDATIYGKRNLSLEVTRGCIAGCRFCYMGNYLRPPRFLSLPDIEYWVNYVKGHGMSLRLFYESMPQEMFNEVFAMLEKEGEGVPLVLGSFRADEVTEQSVRVAGRGGLQCFIVAPETSSLLRPVLNKGDITDDQIFQIVEWAHKYAIPNFGLYLMIGLPTETKSDIDDLADLVIQTRLHMNKTGNAVGVLEIHVNTFFPKPWTSLQWTQMVNMSTSSVKLAQFIERIKTAGINVVNERVKTAIVGAGDLDGAFEKNTIVIKTVIGTDGEFIQSMLARGDRRMAEVLKLFVENNGQTRQDWLSAMEVCGLTPDFYLRKRSTSEVLPWNFIETGMDSKYLMREWKRAQNRQNTGIFCQQTFNCNVCGVCSSK